MKPKETLQRFVFVPLGITVFTAFKPIRLFMPLEKKASLSGLGLAKVVGFTAFKPLKLLISLKKSASCPFYDGKTAWAVHFT